MACQRCKGERIASIEAKSSDCNVVSIGDNTLDGYVPEDMGIGGDDYVDLEWCLDCGQIQGEWPLPKTELEQGNTQ